MIGNRSSATPVKKAGEAAPEGRSAAEQSAPRTCGRGDAVPSLQGFEAEGFASHSPADQMYRPLSAAIGAWLRERRIAPAISIGPASGTHLPRTAPVRPVYISASHAPATQTTQ